MIGDQIFGRTNTKSNMNIYNENNKQKRLLSKFNEPVLILEHNHPLIYSFTLERAKFGTNWRCNKCTFLFPYDKPSFYCIFCDFDICEKCFIQNQLCNITICDYNEHLFDNIQNKKEKLFNWQSIFPCHQHLLTLIKKINENYEWKCNICKMNNMNSQAFYYCSLCDFHLCHNCAIQWTGFMNKSLIKPSKSNEFQDNSGSHFKIDNPKYFSDN